MLEIEIFSDVICPWCYIGKRRLDAVLATDLGEGVSLRWRPYQLYPNIDTDGVDRAEMLRRRYGDDADLGRAPARILEEARGEGIGLRYDLIQRTPNTLQAHRLLEFAYPQGLQHPLAEALFVSYFCNGEDVGDLATLAAIAGGVGLPDSTINEFLAGAEAGEDWAREAVEGQLARAPELGISGVPGYYLANSFLLPGAQTSEVMGQIITRAKTKLAAAAS